MRSNIKEAFHAYLKDPVVGEDKLISSLEKERTKWLKHRRTEWDQRWSQNLAFYSGKHYIRDRQSNSNQYRVRLRENHTNNIINRMVSIFVQNLPVVRVFASSQESEDAQNAESSEDYIKYFWRTKQLEQKWAKLVKYSAIFGNGFAFRQYDPTAGGLMHLSGAETQGKPEERKWRGDVKIEIDDPMKINVRPGIEDMEDHFDFFRSVSSNKSDVENQYGKVESADSVTLMNAYNGQLRTDDDLAMVHHYYHKPTSWWEKGVYVAYCGKKILKATTFPYKSGRLPLDHLPFDKPPLSFWALSTIDQIIDLQEQLNRAASMIIEGRNLIARPRWWVHETAAVPGQSISDIPGSINKWRGQVKPEAIVSSFNFGELASHKSDVRAAIQQVSGISSASRGEIPAATKTALALQLVLEQDRSQWSPFIKQFYQVIQSTTLGCLEFAGQFFPEEDPRRIKVEGGSGYKLFHGGMVPSPLDVYLEDTNPLGWTASGRIEAVQGLYQSGLIKDENKVLEMLDLNNDSPAYASEKLARQTAQRENELLNQGETITVESEDIDPVHLDEHTKEMQSFSYKQKPSVVKQAFEAHVVLHKQRMGGAPQGAPQPGGNPSAQAAAGLQGIANAQAIPQGSEKIDKLLTSARAG